MNKGTRLASDTWDAYERNAFNETRGVHLPIHWMLNSLTWYLIFDVQTACSLCCKLVYSLKSPPASLGQYSQSYWDAVSQAQSPKYSHQITLYFKKKKLPVPFEKTDFHLGCVCTHSIVSDSLWPCGPTRNLHPWDFPARIGKAEFKWISHKLSKVSLDTSHKFQKKAALLFNLWWVTSSWKSKYWSLSHVWLSATPWTVACQAPLSMEFQARILEWVIIPFYRGYSPPKDWTLISRISDNSLSSEPPGKAMSQYSQGKLNAVGWNVLKTPNL